MPPDEKSGSLRDATIRLIRKSIEFLSVFKVM
jgi:hypothetical protein